MFAEAFRAMTTYIISWQFSDKIYDPNFMRASDNLKSLNSIWAIFKSFWLGCILMKSYYLTHNNNININGK